MERGRLLWFRPTGELLLESKAPAVFFPTGRIAGSLLGKTVVSPAEVAVVPTYRRPRNWHTSRVRFDGSGRGWIATNRGAGDFSYIDVHEGVAYLGTVRVRHSLIGMDIAGSVLVVLVDRPIRSDDPAGFPSAESTGTTSAGSSLRRGAARTSNTGQGCQPSQSFSPQNAFRYVSFTTPVRRCQRSVQRSGRSPVRYPVSKTRKGSLPGVEGVASRSAPPVSRRRPVPPWAPAGLPGTDGGRWGEVQRVGAVHLRRSNGAARRGRSSCGSANLVRY